MTKMTKKSTERAIRHLRQAEARRLEADPWASITSKEILEAEIVLAWACVMNGWPDVWRAREEQLAAARRRFSRWSMLASAMAGF